MASNIDFAIAVGTFFTVVAILITYTLSYLNNYTNYAFTSELRTMAFVTFNSLFSSQGIPSNWENLNFMPLKVGLIGDLYRKPITVTETNGTYRENVTVNTSINFDPNCERSIPNSTVRLYDSLNNENVYKLYNQSFCSGNYLRTADLVFNLTLNANQQKTFYLYFSDSNNITQPTYSLDFPVNVTNITVNVYPEDILSMISPAKLYALRKYSVDNVMKSLGGSLNFNLEISK